LPLDIAVWTSVTMVANADAARRAAGISLRNIYIEDNKWAAFDDRLTG
jgi:predicted glycosyltransferase